MRGLQCFRRQLQLFRHAREIEHGRGLHLAHHLAAVGLHRDLTDADVAGNLLVEATLQDLGHYFALAGGQRLEALPQRGQCLFTLSPRAITFKAELDRVEQVLIPDWLGQELDRSSLHGLDRHRDVGVRGDEDDRQIDVRRAELALEVETASSGQPYIEHQASRSFRAPGLQEFRYRCECSSLQTDRSQQGPKRLSDIWIVIDDDDTGLWLRHRSARTDGSTVTSRLQSRIPEPIAFQDMRFIDLTRKAGMPYPKA